MTRFVNGPAAGVSLVLRRAPLFLRVVRERGKWDALDQEGDQPKDSEEIFVYRRVGKALAMHLRCGGKNRSMSGWYHVGEYELHPNPPDDAIARDANAWLEFLDHQTLMSDEREARGGTASGAAVNGSGVSGSAVNGSGAFPSGLFGDTTPPPAAGLPDLDRRQS